MPYDVVAYESDDLAMQLTEAEEGLFHRMLRRAWMNGSIPSDLTALAHVCRTHPARLKAAWKRIAPLWKSHPTEEGRLVNAKQEHERVWVHSKTISARRSANERWKQQETKTIVDANALPSQSERNASPSHSQPSPSPPIVPIPKKGEGESADALPPTPLVFGEFKRVVLTADQHAKLIATLNGSLETYMTNFDRWVNEAPEAKASGVKRKDRHAYESILSWYQRDLKEGKIKRPPSKELKVVY